MNINDELEQMRKRMDTFEKSKRQIDNTLKDLSRMQLAKKPRLDDNFLAPTPETINEVFQTRALIAAAKPGTSSPSNRRTGSRRYSRNQGFKEVAYST